MTSVVCFVKIPPLLDEHLRRWGVKIKKSLKIKFVQLEPNAFLSDSDFQAMTATERGVYWTLLLYLYANDGRLRLDFKQLAILCACKNFEQIWSKIKKKFLSRNGFIEHKRVNKELRKAKRYMQAAKKSGLKGAEKRWGAHSNPDRHPKGSSIAKENQRKGNVIEKESKSSSNSNTKNLSLSSTNSVRTRSLHFYEALRGIIIPRSQSDRTCFQNITKWIVEGCARARFNENIFDLVLDYAKESQKARNPAACFMALLKKELGYERNTANAR